MVVRAIGLRPVFADETVANLRKQIGEDQVILGLSGGVDSTVAAALLHRAIGSQLHCIFVDNGLLRKHEFEEVLESYEGHGASGQRGSSWGEVFRSSCG